METQGCILSTAAIDALVLKDQAISIHSADQISFVLDQSQIKILHLVNIEKYDLYLHSI